jgi:hypothetical protein
MPRNKRRHTLLVKFADQGLHKAAVDPTNWSYTTGDGEASFSVRWPCTRKTSEHKRWRFG